VWAWKKRPSDDCAICESKTTDRVTDEGEPALRLYLSWWVRCGPSSLASTTAAGARRVPDPGNVQRRMGARPGEVREMLRPRAATPRSTSPRGSGVRRLPRAGFDNPDRGTLALMVRCCAATGSRRASTVGQRRRPAGWSPLTCNGTSNAALRSLPLVDRTFESG